MRHGRRTRAEGWLGWAITTGCVLGGVAWVANLIL